MGERYRVRPSLGLVANLATIKIDVFYQPIIPDTDDFSDVLKDKFLINLYKNSSETSYKTDSKEKTASCCHYWKAQRCLLERATKFREKASINGGGIKGNPILHPHNSYLDCDSGIYDVATTLLRKHGLSCRSSHDDAKCGCWKFLFKS